MKNFIKILLGVLVVNMVFANSLKADEVFGSAQLETSSLASSQNALEKSSESYSNYGGVLTYGFEGVTQASRMDPSFGWSNPDLPGNGWEINAGNPVGGSISDTTLPILMSMFFIYFLYRGVSSKKRKSI